MLSSFFQTMGLVLVLTVVQVSFLPTWPEPVRFVNLVLCILVFLAVHGRYLHAVHVGFATGLLLELHAPYPFGVVTLSLLSTLFVVRLLTERMFTNRALYSLQVIGLVATAWYLLARSVFDAVLRWVEPIVLVTPTLDIRVLSLFGWQCVFHSLVLTLLYVATTRFSRHASSTSHHSIRFS